VSEHGTSDDITDSPDAGDLGLKVIVYLNTSVLVGSEASLVKLETGSEGTTTGGYEDNIAVK
jgi:hypothetical protein